MNRGIAGYVCALAAALAACGGGDAGAKKRVPDGEKASAAFLIRTIEAVRGLRDADAVWLLGEGVAEVCGKGCACLARAAGADAADKAGALYACPSLCTADARAKAAAAPADGRIAALAQACTPAGIGLAAESVPHVGDDWLAAFVSGQYLADAYDGAGADDRKAYEQAFQGFEVPLAPTAGMVGVSLAAVQHAEKPGRARMFVTIDANGALRAGDTHGVRFTPKGAEYVPARITAQPDADVLGQRVKEAMDLGTSLADVDDRAGDALAKPSPPPDDPPPDDPPPPEEEDDDDSGGTGTAMALEEGKMGRKDADRATGQYKMKRNDDGDPQLAREQAIEAARNAGVLGSDALARGGAFATLTGEGDIRSGFDDADSAADPLARPTYSVVGLTSRPIVDQVIVIADGAAPATTLLQVLSALPDSVLAASHEGRLVALPLVFTSGYGFGVAPVRDAAQLIVDVGNDTITVGNARLADLTEVKAGDAAALVAAIKAKLAEPAFADRRDVTVNARDDVKVAQVVAAFDAALSAGARAVAFESAVPAGAGTGWGTIGTGRYGTIGGDPYGLGGGRGGMRGRSTDVPSVSIGQPASVGDLDKAIIRRYIKRNIAKIRYCYEKQLLVDTALAGTVTVEFFITPNGSVASSKASGVDDEVASCVAGVVKNIEFPRPKGGGGVNVKYPFTFRSTGG